MNETRLSTVQATLISRWGRSGEQLFDSLFVNFIVSSVGCKKENVVYLQSFDMTEEENKPDRATMRPGCVSACIDHVTFMERQMDEQTGETTKQ